MIDNKHVNDTDLILAYGNLVSELRSRKIIGTKNVVVDLGERFAIDYFNRSNKLEKLEHAPPSTKSFDAIGNQGSSYDIKSVTGNVTGVF